VIPTLGPSVMTGRLGRRVSWTTLAGAIPVAMTVWVYWPLTRSWFWADDFVNMASIANDGFFRFVLRPFGGHNLLVRNAIFYTWWQLFGLHAAPYFWMVLLTHLLNVWLMFRLLRILTSSATLACLGATLWGASPIAVGTLGWYSVFGQVVVGTMFLVVLRRLAELSRADAPVPARTAWTWYALLLLGTLCFGVGLGIALAFPVALFVMLPGAWRQPRVRVAYLALPIVTVVLYVAFRHLYPLLFEPLPFEELTSQPAGVRDLPSVLAGVWNLVCFAASEYPRGFFWAGKTYPDRASPIALTLAGAGIVVLVWRGDPRERRAAVALASLSVGIYFAIALGRTWLLPLPRMAAQLRYHYVAAIPIVTVLCMSLQEVGQIGPLRRVPRVPLLLATLALFGWGRARSPFHVDLNVGPRVAVESGLRTIAGKVGLVPPGGTAYLENGANTKVLLGPVMPNIDFPGLAAIFLITHDDDQVDGRTVRFVERDPAVLAHYRLRPESRLARLLAAPGDTQRAQ
jgi:hypothetical protein